MPDIATIGQQEITLISQFISLLKEEQEILKSGETAALQEISAEKIPLTIRLNALEDERRRALDVCSEDSIREAMNAWLEQHPEEQITAVDWKNLLNLAREAKQLHDLNARLIAMHLEQTTAALAVLIHQPVKSTLYGSNGQTSQTSGSRIIDSA